MIVHHYGKDSTKGMRGASNFTNDVDFAFDMVRDTSSMVTTLSCKKMKDGEGFQDIHMQGHIVDLDIARQDGKPSTSLVLKPANDVPMCQRPAKKSKQLKPAHTNILIELIQSIKENGVDCSSEIKKLYPDSKHLCPKKTIHYDDFRERAYLHIIGEPSSKRTIYRRLLTDLQEAYKLLFHNDYIWYLQ